MVVELGQAVDILMARVVVGRIISEHHQFDALKTHDPVGLGPAAIIANAHAHHAAKGAPDAETQVAWLEIALLQMLVGEAFLRLGMARPMHLPIFPDDIARTVDQDRSVKSTLAT